MERFRRACGKRDWTRPDHRGQKLTPQEWPLPGRKADIDGTVRPAKRPAFITQCSAPPAAPFTLRVSATARRGQHQHDADHRKGVAESHHQRLMLHAPCRARRSPADARRRVGDAVGQEIVRRLGDPVAHSSRPSVTDWPMMLEWNCSRLVITVASTAVPIAPPRLRQHVADAGRGGDVLGRGVSRSSPRSAASAPWPGRWRARCWE